MSAHSPLVSAALAVAASGLPVFACSSRKSPLTKNGFLDATRDPTQIRYQFRAKAAALIGVPTGESTDTVVIDVDVKDGRPGLAWVDANRARLPGTLTHRTQSGGFHLVFAYPSGLDIRGSTSRLAPAIDVRATGNYCCWPPVGGYAVVNPVERAPVPDWLLGLLEQPAPKAQRPPSGPRPETDHLEGRVGRYVDRLLDNVRAAPDGEKFWTLYKNARALGGVLDVLGVSVETAKGWLVDALPDSVEDWEHAKKTAKRMLEKGRESPITLEDKPYERRSARS